MESKKELKIVLTKLKTTIDHFNYKSETKRKYQIAISNFSIFIESYNKEDSMEGIIEGYLITIQNKQYSENYKNLQLRIVRMMQEIITTGSLDGFKTNRKNKICIINSDFNYLFEESIIYLDFDITTSSARIYSQVIRKFCNMVFEEGLIFFSELNTLTLNKIVQGFTKTNPGSMNQVIASLRKFLGFLYSKDLCIEFKMNSLVYKVPKISRRIPCFTRDEVQKLLNCCNQLTELDCRIRAVIMIAVTTGLRACDIATLKRKDIDWKNSTIALRQNKTGKYIKLPLLVETGNAIAKYLIYFRGNITTNNDAVFLQHCRVTLPINSGTIKSQFVRLCNKARIENKSGRSFHSLRRSVATWLSEGDIDPHAIAMFLGHSTFSSINKYIASNPKMARCTLSFDEIPLLSEVYHD